MCIRDRNALAQGTSDLHKGSSRVLSGMQELSTAIKSSTDSHADLLAYLHEKNTGSADSLKQVTQGAAALEAQLQTIINKNTDASQRLNAAAQKLKDLHAYEDTVNQLTAAAADMNDLNQQYACLLYTSWPGPFAILPAIRMILPICQWSAKMFILLCSLLTFLHGRLIILHCLSVIRV